MIRTRTPAAARSGAMSSTRRTSTSANRTRFAPSAAGAAEEGTAAGAALFYPTEPAAPAVEVDRDRGGSVWGESYFPNIPLTSHEGEGVRFFDDLIEGKVVLINFIYTACPDTCPTETARMLEVARLLGDRLGEDVFFHSITVDPEHDTQPVLAEFAERWGIPEGWTFYTGEERDIVHLRKKLGMRLDDVASGRFEGWPAIRAFFASGLSRTANLTLAPQEFWSNGDGLAVHYVMSGDVVRPESFGPELPRIRDWTEQHYDFAGYVTGLDPAAPVDRAETRRARWDLPVPEFPTIQTRRPTSGILLLSPATAAPAERVAVSRGGRCRAPSRSARP